MVRNCRTLLLWQLVSIGPACFSLATALIVISTVSAQTPEINPGGIVNAASYAKEPGLAPGSLVSLFGRNLAASTAHASALPLPTVLAGTSVTVAGVAAPLLFVSPTQVNFQFPSRLEPAPAFPVLVTTAAGESRPEPVSMVAAAPGVFTADGGRCSRGAILNLNGDGTYATNTPENSASPGALISVFGTGLGNVYFGPADGTATVNSAPATLTPVPTVGASGAYSVNATPLYAGRAPGFVGADQINVRLPDNAPEGCSIPIRFGTGLFLPASQPVFMSIARGGGACRDEAAKVRRGNIRWWQSTHFMASSPVTRATLTATFDEVPASWPRTEPDPPPYLGPGCLGGIPNPPEGPSCQFADPPSVSAGSLEISSSGIRQTVNPSGQAGFLRYEQPLPPDTMRGTSVVVGAGSSAIGPFSSSITIPPAPAMSLRQPGAIISSFRPFSVTWTGGTDGAVVSMRLSYFPGNHMITCSALATAGQITLSPGSSGLPIRGTGVELLVTVEPAQRASFSAPSLEYGRHDWRYEYRMPGLLIGGSPP